VLAGIRRLFACCRDSSFSCCAPTLMRQVRAMPTDLLVSGPVGLIIGACCVANLLLARSCCWRSLGGLIFVKPLRRGCSQQTSSSGCWVYNLAEVHGRTLLRLFNPRARRPAGAEGC